MASTAPRKLEFHGEQDEISPLFAPSVTYREGDLLVALANGLAGAPTDTADLIPLGVVTGQYSDGTRDYAYAMGSTSVRGTLKRGKVWLPFSGAAQADVGEPFYLADNNTLTKTAGSKTRTIRALDFKTGYLLFDLRTVG